MSHTLLTTILLSFEKEYIASNGELAPCTCLEELKVSREEIDRLYNSKGGQVTV
jgi:hypothetical protein